MSRFVGVPTSPPAVRRGADNEPSPTCRSSSGACWRKLSAGCQALLAVAYLRKGETYADLACGSLAEEKARFVLSIVAGEITVVEAARQAKVSEQSVGNWKRQFLEAASPDLLPGSAGRRPASSSSRPRSPS